MTAVYICECEHPKSQHKREREGCRALDCGCAKFEADMAASAAAQGVDRTRVLTAVAEVCEDQAAKARAELAGEPGARLLLTHQRLAEVEQERNAAYALVEKIPGRKPIDVLREVIAGGEGARIELVSARQELEQLAEALAEAGERINGMREANVRLLRERDIARDAVRKTAEISASFGVLYAYDAWSCLTEGGCGSRYTMPAAALEHRCGPLTPVRVSITHREEEPTA